MVGEDEMLNYSNLEKEIKLFLIIIILSTITLGIKIYNLTLGKGSVLDVSFSVAGHFVKIIIMVVLYNKCIKPLKEFIDGHNEESIES